MGYSRSEHPTKGGAGVPSSVDELGTRLRVVVSELGGGAAAGKIAGVSDEMISRYLNGRAKPSFNAMAALAKQAGISLDWLATGKEPMHRDTVVEATESPLPSEQGSFDRKLFEDCWMAIEELLEEMGKNPTPQQRMQLIFDAYDIEMIAREEGRVASGAHILRLVKKIA